MKTAMQELIDELSNHLKLDISSSALSIIKIIKERAESRLEKEKKQIVDAYNSGYKACDLDEALEINKTMFSGDRYYDINY